MGIHIETIRVVPIIINLCMLIGIVIYVLKAIKAADKGETVTCRSVKLFKKSQAQIKNEVKKYDNTHVIVLETYRNKKMKK